MEIRTITRGGVTVAVVGGGVMIDGGQAALDLAATVDYEYHTRNLVLPKAALCEDFFKLATGVAGEVAQKFVNYRFRVAVVGDFSGYTSKAFRDYVYECNRGDNLFFVATEAEAVEKLGGSL